MTTRRRALAVLAAGAMLSPVLVTGSAVAEGPGDSTPPPQQPLTALCENVLQTEPFVDIEGGTFERAIECLAAARITQGGPGGLPADQYGPGLVVARDNMASFVARLLDTAAALSLNDSVVALPAYDGSPAFTDVAAGTVHFEAVNRLQQAGIVQGGVGGAPATTYSPQLTVNRAQMASFLARAFAYATGADALQTANDYYTDDEDQTAHQGNINVITSLGIAVGDGRSTYNPREGVQRGQMAAFLTRTMAVMEARGLIEAVRPNSDRLQALITEPAAYRHLEAFQQIADRNDDNRASGLPGYAQSRDYVVAQLQGAGYQVTVQPFEFDLFSNLEPARLSAGGTEFETDSLTYSGSGDVTGPVVDVDPNLGASTSTAGCEAEDFADFPEGAIALIRRGTCPFAVKAGNAEEAGASAAIIYNTNADTDPFVGTLGAAGIAIPVLGVSFDDGRAIAAAGTATVFASTEIDTRVTENVIAQTVRGDQDNVVMLGAHLDSVPEGPGINDNGTGSAAILEVALQAAKEKPTNALRFAWWGAEEFGLLGAVHYVENLSQVERDRIALYLNFDMIGSPNFARFVYDGDDSAQEGAGPGPQGSAAIEYVFSDYFESRGLASEPTDFSGRSDYGPFIAPGVGIPAGGLFTGAEGLKTARQAELYGGTAGEAYDPNYHQPGDTLDNVNRTVFEQNLGAIVHATAAFGASTRGTYDLGAPNRTTGPGTGGGDSSQGGLHDHDHDHDHEQDAA